MNNRNSNKQTNHIQQFVDELMSPSTVYRSRRRATSQQHIPSQPAPSVPKVKRLHRATPERARAQSQNKSEHIFTSSGSYIKPATPAQQSQVFLQRISEISEGSHVLAVPSKGVKFRDNLLIRNQSNKRQNVPSLSRTPSILKRSKLLRQKTIQRLQSTITQLSQKTMQQGDDRQARAIRSNEVIKKRYVTIVERLHNKLSGKLRSGMRIRPQQKYKDELFPPILSSVFRKGISRYSQAPSSPIKWIRLSQLFKDRSLTVIPKNRSNIQIYCNRWQHCNNFIGDCFTAIKDCRGLLLKMFQIEEISQFGVYLVKIFQENVWKYVIVDDYVPTVSDGEGNYIPYFLNICENQQKYQEKQQPIEIWPFLLEKAYANYYANYQSLHFGNSLDFLQELTGSASEQFCFRNNLKKMTQTISKLRSYFDNKNVVLLGKIDQTDTYVPIYRNGRNQLVSKRSYQVPSQEIPVNVDNVFDVYDKVYAIKVGSFGHSCVSTVAINSRKHSSHHENNTNKIDISLRVLKLAQAGTVSLSIRQKQKRFYQNSSLIYNYFWVRVLLFQKQFESSFRWITAAYSNSKSINLTQHLQAGEYYLLILPQWKCSHCYQLSIVGLADVSISMIRKEYDFKERILEKGCEDLAMRQGKMQQISVYACSYCVVEREIGLMIQNINNQRFNGDIRVNRSLGNIKGSVQVVPWNIQFYKMMSQFSKLQFKNHISIHIPHDKAYTVVLITRGGVDPQLLSRFDFAK